jgi:hypothetical protein
VKNRNNLIELDKVARRYGSRPSEILEIGDGWIAYQLDLVTAITATTKTGHGQPPPGGYQKPMASKRVKIPENGVW